jgi:hypothetical protein
LSNIFSNGRKQDALMIGSIKSNIGHLEGGSGIAGVVKSVLMLERKLILPNFNFMKPNPQIPMSDWLIKVSACQIAESRRVTHLCRYQPLCSLGRRMDHGEPLSTTSALAEAMPM